MGASRLIQRIVFFSDQPPKIRSSLVLVKQFLGSKAAFSVQVASKGKGLGLKKKGLTQVGFHKKKKSFQCNSFQIIKQLLFTNG